MNEPLKKQRIWEIDALRGAMILVMIAIHVVIGSQFMVAWYPLPVWLEILMGRIGTIFVVISGISATLGKHTVRRGMIVFGCAIGLELGSYLAAMLGIFDESMVIRFGVLHLIGICMLMWPLLKNSKPWLLAGMGIVIIVLGYWFETLWVTPKFLFALGLRAATFASGDYYPLFPHLGWFMIGGALGKWLYPEKRTLFPKVNPNRGISRFFQWCGRHSLVIYLVHLPVIGGVLMLIAWLFF